MPAPDQINLSYSHPRSASVLAVAAGGLALCVIFLYIRPGQNGPNTMIPGGLSEFAAIFGAILFAFYCVILAKDLLNSNVIVSVGREGVFDRRIATGWIPWNAVRDISIVDHHSQKALLFKLSNSEDAQRALRRKIFGVARNNALGSPREFYIEAGRLNGGFAALHSAVTRFHSIV
ncbi:hypothetical protein [Methylobacterium oryzisoli]|uniref:hypothetical protein n=1 Tax=Methylobacterium oryzisoli TaxID=3385502 RepID=UPI0038921B59